MKELKNYLKTNGALCGVELDAVVLRLNSTPSETRGSGSPFKRFFGRHGRSNIPTAAGLITKVESREMIIAREAAQEKAASKRGHSNRDTFRVSDPVRIRDNGSGLWNQKVVELVEREDQIA